MTAEHHPLQHLTLGKTVAYIDQYQPQLLQAVPRSLNRKEIGIVDQQPFHGVDRWTGYELSWLNMKGKPNVAIMQADVPCSSANLIESKSFKLYLNSFNQTRFEHTEQVIKCLQQDLSNCAGAPVTITLFHPDQFGSIQPQSLIGEVIDDLDIEVSAYTPDISLLQCHKGTHQIEETLVSHLLKSNCLITHQPDWASIAIRYHGQAIDHASLLRYLISFRQHNEFHEQCVERIFCDIKRQCQPLKLTVYARYTRRGGLDINPFRSDFEPLWSTGRLARQ